MSAPVKMPDQHCASCLGTGQVPTGHYCYCVLPAPFDVSLSGHTCSHLRDVTGSAGYVDRANAMGEALSFLARFPREGDGDDS